MKLSRLSISAGVLALAACTAAIGDAGAPVAATVSAEREAGMSGSSTIVETAAGSVSGVAENGVASYKGIPFAQPPVGDLRWRAPQPVEPWTDVFAADSFSNDCMQIPFAADAAPLGTPPAEDCLYLNIWKPETVASGDDLPVIVWIYGGGWVNGGASPAVYDGSPTAAEGTVFVSFNYRLGRFGFFAHPALTAADEDDGLLGNYGYMDQIAALEWVQDNIEAFGGDPDNVTIMGESAGGGSVVNLMTTPLAEGLFDKALAMSAPARMDSTLKPLHAEGGPDAEDDGTGFAEWAGIEGEGAQALAALRALPAETVVKGTGMMQRPVAPASGPMIDGTVIVGADKVFAEGRQARVPTMIGAVSEDLGFGPPLSAEELFAQFPDPEAAGAAYADLAGDQMQLLRNVYADALMIEPARFVAQAQVKAGVPVWHYRYGYVAYSMRDEWTGTQHATEIPFFLKTVEARYGEETTDADREAAEIVNSYLVSFAANGDPNVPSLPEWSQYDDETRGVMLFTFDGPVYGADPWRARLDATQEKVESGQ